MFIDKFQIQQNTLTQIYTIYAQVGFEFSVPFLSVPVKRSVDSVRHTAQSVMVSRSANRPLRSFAC